MQDGLDGVLRPPTLVPRTALAVTATMVNTLADMLEVAEVATMLRLGPVTIYRWCRSGRLAAVKIGKEWRIPRAALTALLPPGAWQRARDQDDEERPMPEVSATGRALARQLLLYEAGGRGESAALAAAASTHARLRGRLAGAIGETGFATLFARARHLAQAEVPELEFLAFEGGLAERAGRAAPAGTRTVDPATTAAAVTAVLAQFIGLLSTFLGEELALRLIHDAWPELPNDVFGVADAGASV